MTEQRLIEIEIKLSRQEDLVETLNDIVYRQQKKIDQLQELCAALVRQMQAVASTSTELAASNEPPPHY